ncbi:MAG: hypothetical protein ACXWE4_03825 [Methylobacter sp.]
MRIGTKADLARDLNISRAAVTQAFKRHNIQLSIDGKFDLDYAAWLLKEKQNQTKSTAQRSATKQPPGLSNPRLKREVIRSLWPIWEEAIAETIKSRAETSYEDEQDFLELEAMMYACTMVWDSFHRICGREFPADIGDFPFKKPECIDFDPAVISALDQLENILLSDESLTSEGPSDAATQHG